MNKFFPLSSGKTAYVRFVIGSRKSATYEVGHLGMTRRIDVAGHRYTFHAASDFTNDSNLIAKALNEAETVEALNSYFTAEHAEYVKLCAKYNQEADEPLTLLSECVKWIGHDGAFVALETAAA